MEMQNSCSFQYNDTKNQKETGDFCGRNEFGTCWPVLVTNKLSVELSQGDEKKTISNYLENGIFNFGLDLFFGSVEQNLNVVKLLQETVEKQAKLLKYSIPISLYLRLSPRLPHTGRFKGTKTSVNLKLHSKVVLTTDRKYASKSCHSIIYVNAKILMLHIKKCDIVCLGEDVQLQVVNVQPVQVFCKVIVGGRVATRTRVRFPNDIQEACRSKLSTEELEDITLAVETQINVIVTYNPGTPEYCNQLREVLSNFKCSNYYLFARCTMQSLENNMETEWIAKAYDGFLFDFSKPLPKNEVIRLSNPTRSCMKSVYEERKPIFVKGCWSSCVHPEDYEYSFYYPDKYIVPCKSIHLRLFEAVFDKFAKLQLVAPKTYEKQCSKALAKSIVAASFDFQADAIVICSTLDEKVIEISHNRPKAIIICVTRLQNMINYSSMHHNVWMLSHEMEEPNEFPVSHKNEVYQKLLYGVRFGLLKKLVLYNSTVILVFGDSFAVVKIDERFAETIRSVI